MRGKVYTIANALVKEGITPAYAGKSHRKQHHQTENRDHPRVCGEKSCPSIFFRNSSGSPPRMRGKGRSSILSSTCTGITPAYAGKRLQEQPKTLEAWDHPRVCGEKSLTFPKSLLMKGSPPRMRGKAPETYRYVAGYGITPAYAGKRLKRSHSIGHFSCILCLFHSVLHRASASGGSRAGPCAPPCLPAQNAVPV